MYSFIMGSVSLILIVESIQALATNRGDGEGELHVPSVIAVSVAFGEFYGPVLDDWGRKSAFDVILSKSS